MVLNERLSASMAGGTEVSAVNLIVFPVPMVDRAVSQKMPLHLDHTPGCTLPLLAAWRRGMGYRASRSPTCRTGNPR